jgi:dipeptidyl aminopeptidase/acylaminoacyl peptidase
LPQEALVRHLLLSLLVLAFTLPAIAQSKHPFTFDDMMKLKRVGDPQVSPDGKWVIFSVVDVDLGANAKTPHIWIVPTAGGQEREIIADQDADRPRWAPDGKRFAFLSTKEGGSQVWVAEFDTAQGTAAFPRRVTSLATEADGELWSPDGKHLLFTSNVYPACDDAPEAEVKCNEQKLKEAEQAKVKAMIFDGLLYRHWNAYKEGKRGHIFVIRAEGPRFVKDYSGPHVDEPPRDLTPGDYDAPVFSLGGQDDYAFSPDGQEICYASNHDKNPAASTNNDLWIVPVNAGMDHGGAGDSPAQVLAKTKNITADNPASDSSPLYSPDGRYIAYRAQQRPGYESDRFRLMLYDRKTGEKKNLTEDFDRWVGTLAWAPNSSRIYFNTGSEGKAPIFSLLVATGKRVEVPTLIMATQDDMVVAPNGDDVYFTNNSLKSPNDIYVFMLCPTGCDPPPPPAKQLTHFNDTLLSQIQMQPLESFSFTGAHNDKVEGFLVKPPNFDASKKYPVKFLIHGGPQGAWGDDWSYRWNPELFATNGYVVIMINFHGSTGYGQKFIDAINGDWGGAPYEDLMKGLDYAEKTYPFIDKNRECALGASYGGYAINWILGHTDRFKCLVSHDGMFNAESAWGTTEELWFNNWEFKGTPYDNRASYQKWSPHQYAKNFKTPTLVVHGQRDYRLDASEGFQLFTTLQMEGVPSKMLYFPDEGHWVLKPQNSRLWYQTVNEWVDQWTK